MARQDQTSEEQLRQAFTEAAEEALRPFINLSAERSAHDADEDTWARYHADCPWCKAAIRQPCVNTATGQRASVTHPARIEAARGLGLVAK